MLNPTTPKKPRTLILVDDALGGLLGSIAVSSSPVIHVGHGADMGALGAILQEHAKSIAEEVLQVIAIKMEQSAVV